MRLVVKAFAPTLIFLVLLGLALAGAEEQPYELSWRYVTGGRVVAKPAVDHRGMIYILSDDRILYALSPLGRERWRYPVGRKLSTSAVVTYDGTVLIGTQSGILLASGANGRLRWMFSPRTGSCLTPALGSDGSIVLATSSGVIYNLSYTGKERWRYQARAELISVPSIAEDGTIYIGTTDRRLLALNRHGGKIWELELPAGVGTPVIDDNGNLYLAAAGIHRVSPQGVLLWSYAIPAETADPVIRSDGTIIAGADNGRLYAISPAGRQIWSSALRVPVRFPAVLGDDGTAYVSTASQDLVAVSAAGRVLWRFRAKQSVGMATIGKDGTVLVGAEDWILYALSAGSTGLSASPWPQLYHDGQHTGRAEALADLDSPAAVLLRELVYSDSPDLKRMALRDIEAHLQGQRYLAVHLMVLEEVLGYLAGEGVIYRGTAGSTLGPSDPEIRREACRLLGELGSEGARAVLLQVMAADEDSVVKIAAVDGLATVGFDPDGELARAILYKAGESGQERFHLACARALFRIIMGSQSAVHPDNYLALAMLAQRDASPNVRERASGYLSDLSQRWRR
ncbi:MAG: PQQ-binding-like beta-propeller repeat protein [Spirochaetaceae bacterium]|nr:MAG: PQQ-binding-like beta-propeller repeat protein [Spirochaetaceae bacterium]